MERPRNPHGTPTLPIFGKASNFEVVERPRNPHGTPHVPNFHVCLPFACRKCGVEPPTERPRNAHGVAGGSKPPFGLMGGVAGGGPLMMFFCCIGRVWAAQYLNSVVCVPCHLQRDCGLQHPQLKNLRKLKEKLYFGRSRNAHGLQQHPQLKNPRKL